MKKSWLNRVCILVLVMLVLFFVAYLVFPDDIKSFYVIAALNCPAQNIQSAMLKPVEQNADTIFFKALFKATFSDIGCSPGVYQILIGKNQGNLSKENLRFLIKSLKDKNPTTRYKAAFFLAELKEYRAIDHLIIALNDSDSSVIEMSARALAIIGNEKAVPYMLKCLSRGTRWKKTMIMRFLCNFKDNRINPVLINIVNDKNEDIYTRSFAVKVLAYRWEPSLFKKFKEFLRSDKSEIRYSTAQGLFVDYHGSVKIKDGDVHKLFKEIIKDPEHPGRVEVMEVLENYPRKGFVEAVAESLKKTKGNSDSHAHIKTFSLNYLRKIDYKGRRELAINALKDKNPEVRKAGVLILSDFKDKQSIDMIIDALKDKDKEVREEAALSLGFTGDKRAVDSLIAALKDNEDEVKVAAIVSLGKIKDKKAFNPIVEVINMASGEKAVFNRSYTSAIKVLGELGDKRGIKILGRLLKSDRHHRYEIIKALGNIEDEDSIKELKKLPGILDKELEKDLKERQKHEWNPLALNDYKRYEELTGNNLIEESRKEIKRVEKACLNSAD